MNGLLRSGLFALSIGLLSNPVGAAEIRPGVSIAPAALDAPINEQPYFGFATKTEGQKAADARFLSDIDKQGHSRADAAKQVIRAGWEFALGKRDYETAAKRFNQAYLLDPSQSQIAHGFAIIVMERFRNPDYALALLKAAAQLSDPSTALLADHARILLISKRPQEAIPLLQEAIRRTPDWPVPYLNLANAYFDLGQMQQACEALTKIPPNTQPNIKSNSDRIKALAKCN
jgi:tetratricopeptide (TPR) repeat protein